MKGVRCGVWQPLAKYISPEGNTGLHPDTMMCDREYDAFHIEQISVLCVRFLLLAQQSVISGFQNVLLIFIGLEW
jgi:hypothetical protein